MVVDIISVLLDLLPVMLGGPFLDGLAQITGMLVSLEMTMLPIMALI